MRRLNTILNDMDVQETSLDAKMQDRAEARGARHQLYLKESQLLSDIA